MLDHLSTQAFLKHSLESCATEITEEYMPTSIKYEEKPIIVIVSNPNGEYNPPDWNKEVITESTLSTICIELMR